LIYSKWTIGHCLQERLRRAPTQLIIAYWPNQREFWVPSRSEMGEICCGFVR
jgi:hypothetical protein